MTDKEIESKIKNVFAHAAPDVFDDILCRIQGSSALKPDKQIADDVTDNSEVATFTSKTLAPEEEAVKPAKVKSRKPVMIGAILAGLAAAAAVIIPVGISSYNAANTVASVVSIDVNPSIEIDVNKDRRVISVIPLNEDAKDIIGDMDFKGTDLNVTINALLGSMISKGYLSEIANSILISVDNADPKEAAALQELLMSEVEKILSSDTFNGAIIGQTIKEDEQLRELAEQYGITLSKAQLIKELIAQNNKLKFEELVKLTINDLNLLKKKDMAGVTSIGNASDSGYVGLDTATMTALENAGFDKNNVAGLSSDMDYEGGKFVYEINFDAGGKKYEYEIDAVTGKILKGEQDKAEVSKTDAGNPSDAAQPRNNAAQSTAPAGNRPAQPSQPSVISYEKAKSAALSHAGVGAGSIYDYGIELDYDGTPHYEIEFKSGNREFSYEINAYNGSVIRHEIEYEEDYHEAPKPAQQQAPQPAQTQQQTRAAAPSDIGGERAKSIALGHAGVSAGSARDIKVERDNDDGHPVYDVEFKAGGFEYSYEIDGSSGSIIDFDREKDD